MYKYVMILETHIQSASESATSVLVEGASSTLCCLASLGGRPCCCFTSTKWAGLTHTRGVQVRRRRTREATDSLAAPRPLAAHRAPVSRGVHSCPLRTDATLNSVSPRDRSSSYFSLRNFKVRTLQYFFGVIFFFNFFFSDGLE